LIIQANLTIHTSRQVKLALAAWTEIQLQFIPKYACWLTLIEPRWNQLRALALKGWCFKNLDQLTLALNQELDYWNSHRHPYLWKKKPEAQFSILGGFSVSTPSFSLAV